MFRLFGAVAAMAIPVAHAHGAGLDHRAEQPPVEVCEALPDDVPIEQTLVTDPTIRHPPPYDVRHAMSRSTPR